MNLLVIPKQYDIVYLREKGYKTEMLMNIAICQHNIIFSNKKLVCLELKSLNPQQTYLQE
jgi:hypothetical protein